MSVKTGTIKIKKGKAKTLVFKFLSELSVVVGLPSDRVHEPSGKPLSELGAIHEFGLPGGAPNGYDIPQRSFLRGFINYDESLIKEELSLIALKSYSEVTAKRLMEQFALWAEGRSKLFFVRGNDWPPNAPLTIFLKDGKDTPLINTGALRQGIIGVVLEK